jgi:hypothetical protein
MKFRKKPVVIEAEQYHEGLEDGFDIRFRDKEDPNSTWGIQTSEDEIPVKIPYINTLEGKHYITEGDWIVTGVKGERYPVKNDIFLMTYEKVE